MSGVYELLIACLVAISSSTTQASDVVCPSGWTPLGLRCIRVYPYRLSFLLAQKVCTDAAEQSNGAGLAEITSEQEHKEMMAALIPIGKSNAWIGLADGAGMQPIWQSTGEYLRDSHYKPTFDMPYYAAFRTSPGCYAMNADNTQLTPSSCAASKPFICQQAQSNGELAVPTEPSCTNCSDDTDFAMSAMCRSTVFVGKVVSESPTEYYFNVSRICKRTRFDGLRRYRINTSLRKQCVPAVLSKGRQWTYTVAKSTGRQADCSAPCGLFLKQNTKYLIGAVFNRDALVTLDGGVAMTWGPVRNYFKRKVVVPQHCGTMAQDN